MQRAIKLEEARMLIQIKNESGTGVATVITSQKEVTVHFKPVQIQLNCCIMTRIEAECIGNRSDQAA